MHEVYVHFLNGGPFDGDKVPNRRPWENLVVTKYCDFHQKELKNNFSYDFENCISCKRHKYIKTEPEGFQEADCLGLEVITPDGIDQAPIIHRVNMNYKGETSL
jgi:hypothetical protein